MLMSNHPQQFAHPLSDCCESGDASIHAQNNHMQDEEIIDVDAESVNGGTGMYQEDIMYGSYESTHANINVHDANNNEVCDNGIRPCDPLADKVAGSLTEKTHMGAALPAAISSTSDDEGKESLVLEFSSSTQSIISPSATHSTSSNVFSNSTEAMAKPELPSSTSIHLNGLHQPSSVPLISNSEVRSNPGIINSSTADSSQIVSSDRIKKVELKATSVVCPHYPNDTSKSPHLLSVMCSTGPYSREAFRDNSNFKVIRNDPSRPLPETKTEKKLVLKKRSRAVFDVEYDPSAWIQMNGVLTPNMDSDCNKRSMRRRERELVRNSNEDDSENEDFEFDVAFARRESIDDKADKSRRNKGRLSEKKTSSRVGYKYQAVIPDHPLTYKRENDKTNYTGGSVLWDPVQADAALQRGEGIEEFLEKKDLELNVKYCLMESLHHNRYDVKAAMKTFIYMYKTKQKSLVEFNQAEEKQFSEIIAPSLLATKKDFKAAALAMGRTKETIMVHYYRWKRQRREYALIKRDRKKDPEYCYVCDDGGTLILCELCRKAFHLGCCTPPLTKIPPGDWYCTRCIHASPARLRRLGSGNPLDTSSQGQRDEVAARQERLSSDLNSATKERTQNDLRFLHKELAPSPFRSLGIGAKPSGIRPQLVPSGMFYNKERASWVLFDTNNSKPVPSAEWHDAVSEKSESPDSVEEETEAEVLSTSHESGDSSFKVDAANDVIDLSDDDDDLDYNDKKKKANPKVLVQVPNPLPPSTSTAVKVYYYDVQCPITEEGLLLNITSHALGGVCFSGYRTPKNGGQGPAERLKLFKALGDQFTFVDGQSCEGKSFGEIRSMLKEMWNGQKCKYLRMAHKVQTPPSVPTTIVSKPPYNQQTRPVQPPPVPNPLQSTKPNFPTNNGTNGSMIPNVIRPPAPNPTIVSRIPSFPPQQQQTQRPPVSLPPPQATAYAKQMEYKMLVDALAPMNIPDLLTFLRRFGIVTAGGFLNANASMLATEWSRARQLQWDVALDFMGAARLQVRQYMARSKNGR